MASATPHAPPPPRVPIPRNGVDYRNKVVLAPMVRSGELPTRLLALKYGADLVWGPETIDRSLIGTSRRVNPQTLVVEFTRFPSNGGRVQSTEQKESVIYRIHPTREQGRLIFQMGTSSPSRAVEAARLVAGDVAGIDVNAGCPKSFSTSGGMGAALLRTPDTLCAILSALVKEVGNPFEIGISVKIRLLETREKTESLVRALCATGITGLTIHCRTTPMRPRERAIRDQLAMIGDICREAGVACVMNGDVEDRDAAVALMREYGVDGAMVATAAESNPSCFRARAEGGTLPWRTVVAEYLRVALEVNNRYGNTKFLLGQLIPGKDEAYRKITGAKNYCEVIESLGLMEELGSQARDLDDRLGISGRRRKESGVSEQSRKGNKSAAAAGMVVDRAAAAVANAPTARSARADRGFLHERGGGMDQSIPLSI
ncbi:MAG: Inorganic pyrophosphatase [Chaenotheca gracillima]|nr:MAG: Inorganic pyrophosphatase [Chaenotheca gracillima]